MNATDETSSRIRDNYLRLKERVVSATEASGRQGDDVTIVGVTKYVDSSVARGLYLAGCHDLGESRPQMLQEKAEAMTDCDVRWHMIGHLQRNKAGRTLQYASVIHSVDSVRLASALDRLSGEQERNISILLEVNVSGDSAKHGFHPEQIGDSMEEILALENVNVDGLMGMAGLESDEVETGRQFSKLRILRDELQATMPDGHSFNQLSMGMSGDFELAIAEGATIIRVGSVLFEGIS